MEMKMIEFIKYCFEIDDRNFRGVVPGGAMAPPDFGRSVNQGERLCPPNYYWHPRISDLPTTLNFNNLLQWEKSNFSKMKF